MYAKFGKRSIDFLIASIATCAVAPVILLLIFLIMVIDRRNPFFCSERVGRGGEFFTLFKLRTMATSAPLIASNELDNPSSYISPLGSFLRKTSLDELPQLLLVISGKMSLVGPRPALPSQIYLCEQRNNLGIVSLRPGLTGLAQVNGRDLLSDDQKVALDLEYVKQCSLIMDIRIIAKTVSVVLARSNMLH